MNYTPERLLKDRGLLRQFFRELVSKELIDFVGGDTFFREYAMVKRGIMLQYVVPTLTNADGEEGFRICISPHREDSLRRKKTNFAHFQLGPEFLVWQDGVWVKRGPWMEHVFEYLGELIKQIEGQDTLKDKQKKRNKEEEFERKLRETWA